MKMQMRSSEHFVTINNFKSLLLDTCGFTFANDREQTLYDGVVRRMAACNIASITDYHDLLVRDPAEMDMLIQLLTVNETYFFREPEQLRLMADRLLPELIKKQKTGRLKIVSAGCSTGEEAYSIAMLLHDRYGEKSDHLFSIVGVDIDSTAISRAIKGVYSKYSFRAMEVSFLKSYFEPVECDSFCIASNLFRIKEFIRRSVFFQVANLNSEIYPPAARNPDIIFYRNVSIYFPVEVQQAIFRRLANSLATGGYLVVSSTETIHHNIGILSLMEIDDLFVYKKFPSEERVDLRKTLLKPRKKRGEITGRLKSINSAGQIPCSTTLHKQPEQALPTKNSDSSIDAFNNALEHNRANRTEQAITILKKIIEREPDFLNAHLLLAIIMIDTHNLKEAEYECHAAMAQDHASLPAYLMLGIIAHQTGRNDEGLKRLREAIYIDCNCWPAHFYLAETANMLGDNKRAASAYQSALDILEKEAIKQNNVMPGKNVMAENRNTFFPLNFNAEQFQTLCRHKLNLLRKAG